MGHSTVKSPGVQGLVMVSSTQAAPRCLRPPCTVPASQRRCNGEGKKAEASLSVALEKRRRLSKYSWRFDDKTFDRNMNDMNTLISSLRSFNSNYESRGVNVGSSYSNAPEGGEAIIRDKTQSISACTTHTNQGGGGLGETSEKKNTQNKIKKKTTTLLLLRDIKSTGLDTFQSKNLQRQVKC